MLTSKLVCTFVLAYLSAAALAVEAPPAAAAPPPAVAPSVPSSPVPKPINVASTEFQMKGSVDDIQWVCDNRQTVVVLTSEKTVYLSHDLGKTWQDQSPKISSAANIATHSTGGQKWDASSIEIKKLVISKADRKTIFYTSTGNTHYITRDCGKSVTAVHSAGVPFDNVIMHPTDHSMILASAMSKACNEEDGSGCFRSVYITKDFGASWTYLINYIVQFDWVHNLEKEQAKGLPVDGIVATVFRTKSGNQKFGFWDKDIDFIYTEDLFKTSNVEIRHGNRFLFTDKFLFVAAAHADRSGEVTLYKSTTGGATFEPVVLPYEIRQHSYTVLDTSEDQVFLHVNHEGDGAAWGNVYISDAVGQHYALSLPHNVRDVNGKCDFEKVEGLEGIYMANFINNPVYRDLDDPDREIEAAVVRTVITFDKGGVWGYLRPPQYDSNRQPINCFSEDCSLHLHGITDEWGPFYSNENAVGLMMATGSVGSSLSRNRDDINTYFTNDAGLTWFEVAKGSHIYEFGDHGGLIVMAVDHKPTDTLLFSWNEGVSWHEYKFTTTPIHVENIIIEPTSTSTSFIVYGSRAHDTGHHGILVALDFSSLHTRSCVGVEAPGSSNSDYEYWSPSDGRLGGKCLMGHTVSYVRRKREAECFNPAVMEKSVERKHCSCTEEDYECDEGFARKLEGGACLRVAPVNNTVPDCPHGSTYFVSNGYRKVAGDTCVGGVNHNPTELSCPHWVTKVGHSGKVSIFILLALAVGVLVVGIKKGALNPVEMLSSLTSLFSRSGGSDGGPAYGRIGEMEPETALNYPTYGDDEDFGLDTEDDRQEATLLDDGFNSNNLSGAVPVRAENIAVPAVRPPPSAPGPTAEQQAAADADMLLGDLSGDFVDGGDNDFFGDSI